MPGLVSSAMDETAVDEGLPAATERQASHESLDSSLEEAQEREWERSLRKSPGGSNPRSRIRTASPPTPSSPAATPREETTPLHVKEAKKSIELENAAMMARIRVMQSPERLATAVQAERERTRAARREAEEDASSIQQGHKLVIHDPVTGSVKELTSSPLFVVFSICIPEAAHRPASSQIRSRPSTGQRYGRSIRLSEFVSFDLGDVPPASESEDDVVDEYAGMGQNISGYDDSMPSLDSISNSLAASLERTSASADGFRPVVFLELSDMVNVTIDLPPDVPGSRVADTESAFVGLSMSLEVENFQTWQDTPRSARHAGGVLRLDMSDLCVAYASDENMWLNPVVERRARHDDSLFEAAVVLNMSDLFVFDHLFDEGVLVTYPVSTGVKRRYDGTQAVGERERQRRRSQVAASCLARAWRCHAARVDFERAMDRLIQDPGELIKGWAHRLVEVEGPSAPLGMPRLNLDCAELTRADQSPGKASRRSATASARSGLISVRSARSASHQAQLSPMSCLLVETKQVLQWLPEQQASSLLGALLQGASPVSIEAQSRVHRALVVMSDMASRTLSSRRAQVGDEGGAGATTDATDGGALPSPLSSLHKFFDSEQLGAEKEEGVVKVQLAEQVPEELPEETEEEKKDRLRDLELDEKSLHVEVILEDVHIDQVGGEMAPWLGKQRARSEKERSERAGVSGATAAGETSQAGDEAERKRVEEEQERDKKMAKLQRDFCQGLVKELAKGMDGDRSKIQVLSLEAGSVIITLQLQEGVCPDLYDIDDVIQQLHEVVDEARAERKSLEGLSPGRRSKKRPKWRLLSRASGVRVIKMPKAKEVKQAWEPEEPATAAPAEEAPVEQVDIAAEPADDDAEQRLAELAAAEDDSVIEREKPGVGTRFWNRVTNVWPLQEWFKYDGCEVRVRDSNGSTSRGRLCVMEDMTELRIWKDSDEEIPHDSVVRETHELAAPGELQIGPNCRLRKCYTKPDGSSQTISTNGQLLMRDGDVVGVKTSTRYSHSYMGLLSFLKNSRADEMSLVTMEGNAAALIRCPCFEWEGACKRCKGEMAAMGVHHAERKIRVNVVDLKRGVDAWVPLYVYASHQLMTASSFCKSAGVNTVAPMRVLKIQLGGGLLPDGWRVDCTPEGYMYSNFLLRISQDHHPSIIEKSLQELGISESRVRASSQAEFNASLARSRTRGRPSRVGPDGRWQVGTSQRTPTADSSVATTAPHTSSDSVTDKPQSTSLLLEDADGGDAGGASKAPAKAKSKRKKVAKRVYKAKRTIPPYSHAAWSSAMLLQSVFRGHTQRVLLLVTRRLQPTFEMPIRIASLAHTMIQMPTAFKMFKRMLLYYKRHGRGMRIPALDYFRWPNPDELRRMLAKVLLLQCAYRQHLGVRRFRHRLYERAEAAQIENIIKSVQKDIGSQSTVDATMSIREGLAAQGPSDQSSDELSTHISLSEAERQWLESCFNCPLHKENILYLASRDGWDPAVMRDRCNDKDNLLMLVASSSAAHGGNGSRTTHVFGAFTSLAWQRHGGFKEDPSAHLFSLRSAGPGGKESAVPQMFRCQQVKQKDRAVMHYTTLSEYDGKFWSGGLIFGAGPDLHIDLDNPTRCITQLGSTYELPKACAISEEGPAFLAGSSPFEALDLAVYQMVNFRAVNAAAELAAQRAERHQVDLDRIHSIGEWLEDQNIESSNAFSSEGRKERKPLQLSPALIITRPLMDVLTEWFDCPDLKLGKCLYLASRDGFSNETFHDRVDGVGPATCMLVRTASRFLFGSFNTVPWQSKKRLVDANTGEAQIVADDIGSWVYDDKAYLFRIEPGPPVKLPVASVVASASFAHVHVLL